MLDAIVTLINRIMAIIAPEQVPTLDVEFLRQAQSILVHERDNEADEDNSPRIQITDSHFLFDVVDILSKQDWQPTWQSDKADLRLMFMRGDTILGVLFVGDRTILRKNKEDGGVQRYKTSLDTYAIERIQERLKPYRAVRE